MIKMINTSGFLAAQESTKHVFVRISDPYPTGASSRRFPRLCSRLGSGTPSPNFLPLSSLIRGESKILKLCYDLNNTIHYCWHARVEPRENYQVHSC